MADQTVRTEQANGRSAARRTRRQLLAGGTGALAAVLTAEALARPAPAYAGTDGDVVLGAMNRETTTTTIFSTIDGIDVLDCSAVGRGTGLHADSESGIGVGGSATSGDGVSGASHSGRGVHGLSGNTGSAFKAGIGVSGITDNISGVGVLGENAGGGVGVSGTAVGQFGTGVLGTGGNVGVQGTGGNTGVLGVTSKTGGFGVWGLADSASCTAVRADNSFGGDALVVAGKAVFSRSGFLTVAAGKSSATHAGVHLTSGSLVLATMQQNHPGVFVQAAVPNVAGSSFTVHLSKTVPARTKVAWFIVN